MSTEMIGLILTILVTAVGATWALRTKLSDIERALTEHVASDTARFAAQDAKIIEMKGWRPWGR